MVPTHQLNYSNLSPFREKDNFKIYYLASHIISLWVELLSKKKYAKYVEKLIGYGWWICTKPIWPIWKNELRNLIIFVSSPYIHHGVSDKDRNYTWCMSSRSSRLLISSILLTSSMLLMSASLKSSPDSARTSVSFSSCSMKPLAQYGHV